MVLVPHQDLAAAGDGAWRAHTSDPQFLVHRALAPGWYIFELACRADAPGSQRATMYFDLGFGFAESGSFALRWVPGQATKRFFYLPQAAAGIRFDPVERPGTFSIDRCAVKPVTAGFARGRIRRKLAQRGDDAGGDDVDLLLRYESAVAARSLPGEHLLADWSRVVEPPVEVGRETLLSIVVPCFRTRAEWAQALLASVVAQRYQRWELICVDDGGGEGEGIEVIAAAARRDDRICLQETDRNRGISAATNLGLAACTGEWILLLDHDDELGREALPAIAQAIERYPDAGWIYTDEDKIDVRGEHCEPHLKSTYDPLLGLGQHYASHLSAVRKELIDEVGGMREGFEGSQDHDLWLRCTARLRPEQVVHVPRICYHWRRVPGSTATDAGAKSGCSEASLRALRERCAELDPGAEVSPGGLLPHTYRVRWSLPSPPPLVSVIIPTRNGLDLLRTCLSTIDAAAGAVPLELVIVDNGSDDPATVRWLEEWVSGGPQRRVIRDDGPFNYPRLNNRAAAEAAGGLLLLCNNDIEFTQADAIEEMVRQVLRPGVAAVGARLLYPDGTLQHGGVVLGLGGVAGHAHKHLMAGAMGSFGRAVLPRQVSAVTGALMMVRADCFREVDGLDEDLAVAFNDVDLCLRLREAGHAIVWTPHAEAVHHESVSRGPEDSPAKRKRFIEEVSFMRARWSRELDADPFYSPHLTRQREDYSLRDPQTYPGGEELAATYAPRPGGHRPRRNEPGVDVGPPCSR